MALLGLAPLSAHATHAIDETGRPSDGAPAGQTMDIDASLDAVRTDTVTSPDALPDDLVAAIDRDLGMTPTEYVESGSTARVAGQLIEDLATQGIAPSDVELTGPKQISVAVDNAAEAAAVEAYGALPVERTEEAGAPSASTVAPMVRALADTVPAGSKYLTSTYHACTLGFWGYDSSGQPVALTAGHCAKNASGPVSKMQSADPWGESGAAESGSFGAFHLGMYGSGYDATLVLSNLEQSAPGHVDVFGSAGPQRVPVYGWTAPVVGANVCKSGARTGWTCGVITELPKDFVVSDEGSPTVSGMSTTLCSASGDSGSPILSGNYAVGILSFGSFSIKPGDTEGACDMSVQVERFKAEALNYYPGGQREAALQLLEADPHRLILTGAQAMTGPGQTIESLFGNDFTLAVAMPVPKLVKKSATKARTVIKGHVDLMGRTNTEYKVKVKIGPRNYVVTPDAKGDF
ncbi:MAG: S1 family peptidase, partial [Bifidobacteriaceae bacterium]|nr:S1 family peptidase [Bifidobacteriaceae bacterium]